jgi:hypothetical protein
MARSKNSGTDTIMPVGNHWVPLDGPYGPKADELAIQLGVVATARQNGVANLPPSTDLDLDECQRKIVAAGDRGTATLAALADNNMRAAENEINALMPRLVEPALEEADLHRGIAEEKRQCEDALDERHKARQSTWRHRELFKLDNGLIRPASYNDDNIVFGLTLVAMAIVEALGNAWILKEATEGGWTGGFLLAVAVGFVNIALGLAVGFIGLRWIEHTSRARRADGWIVIVVGALFAFGTHIVMAHFREALERAHGEAVTVDFSIVLKPWEWFAFSSLEPFILFILGMLFFLVAAAKGRGGSWGIVDPYPGYKTVDANFQQKDEALILGKQEFKDGIKRAYDEQREKLRARHAGDESNLIKIHQIASDAARLVRDVKESNTAWIEVTAYLLRLYREENRKVRTALSPRYFEEFPSFADLRGRTIEDERARSQVSKAEAIVIENTRKLAALEEKLTREQTEEIEHFLARTNESEERAEKRLVRDEVAPDLAFSSPANRIGAGHA